MKEYQTPVKVFMFCLIVLLSLGALAAAPYQGAIPVPKLNAAAIAVILGTILTGLADYAPGLAAQFDALTVASKRLVMLIGAVVIVVGVFAGQCAGIFATDMVCSPVGAVDVLYNVILVFALGQGTHAGIKPSADFKRSVLKINPSKASKVGI